MGFWSNAGKGVLRILDWIVYLILAVIITLAIVAYFAVKKAFRTLDDVVQHVKTGTTKLVSSVEATLQSTAGVFQGVQHQVNDLILFVKNGINDGIHKVTENYKLVKQSVQKINHYITDGDWADTQIFANFETKVHQIISSTLRFPETRDFTINGVSLASIGTDNIKHDLVKFKMKALDTATCILDMGFTANALANAGIDAGEKIYIEIDKDLFQLNDQLITLVEGIIDTGTNYRIQFDKLISEIDNGVATILKKDIKWNDLI